MIRKSVYGLLIIYLTISLSFLSTFNAIQIEKVSKITSTSNIKQELENVDIGSTCIRALMDSVPASFCYKEGADFGIIPTKCPDGWFRDLALCFERCKVNYNHILGICYKNCPDGYKDHGFTCYESIFSWNFKSSYIPKSITNFNEMVPCPEGYYRSGALCYRDCSNIQMYNCGIGACSADKDSCMNEILGMVADTLMGIADAIVLVATLGSTTALASAKIAVKKGLEKLGKMGVQKVFNSVKKMFSGEFAAQLKDKAMERAEDLLDAAYNGKIAEAAINTVCGELFKEVTSEEVKAKEEVKSPETIANALDVFKLGVDVYKGCKNVNEPEGAYSCAKNTVNRLKNFDPTGLLTIASALMKPVCNVPAMAYEMEPALEEQIKEAMLQTAPNDCIVLYELCNFQGRKQEICKDTPKLMEYNFNNLASSIKTGSNVNVMLFERENYQGRHFLMGNGAQMTCLKEFNVDELNFNNMVSSVKFNLNPCVILSYSTNDKQYKGMLFTEVRCKETNFVGFDPKELNVKGLTIEVFDKNMRVTLVSSQHGEIKTHEIKTTKRFDNIKDFPLPTIDKILIKKAEA
jgi:hypothetical protein